MPLPKSGNDFRPISLLAFPSKVLEKLFIKRLFLPSLQRQFSRRQFAFTPGRDGGCTNALLDIRLSMVRHITNAPKNYRRMLAIDFSKAFDSVSHYVLLQTLQDHFLCPTNVIAFVSSFLSNRCQRVTCSSKVCDFLPLTSGVPQGSILGPMLFAAVVDDIEPVCHNSHIVVYADDVTILHHVACDSDDSLQLEASAFAKWASSKRVSINAAKTKAMMVSRSRSAPPAQPIYLNGTKIVEANRLKILGLTFSQDASWGAQLDDLYVKCCRAMSLVKRVWSSQCRPAVVWTAYMGLVFSNMAFGWPVLCDISDAKLARFERLEKMARRWSNQRPELLLRRRLDRQCERLAKRIARDCNSHRLAQYFVVRRHTRPLRHNQILALPPCKSALLRNSFLKFAKHT